MTPRRLDRVTTAPGVVRGARTYSLVLTDDRLYVLDIGPAMGPRARSGNPISDWLADKMIRRIQARTNTKVELGLRDVVERGPEAASQDKGSTAYTPTDIAACTLTPAGTLKLKTSGRSYTFSAPPGEGDALQGFGQALAAWAGVS